MVLESIPGEEDELDVLAPPSSKGASTASAPESKSRRGRRRTASSSKDTAAESKSARKPSSRRARSSSKGEADSGSEEAPRKGRRSGAGRGTARVKSTTKVVSEENLPPQEILVNTVDPNEDRVVVVEEGRIVDLQMSVDRHRSFVNDIYRGRVVNLEPAIGAAFVDFGQGRNGFLHASDVMIAYGEKGWSLEKLLTTQVDEEEWGPGAKEADLDDADAPDAEAEAKGKGKSAGGKGGRGGRSRRPRVAINEVLQKGQLVVVQVTKNAIGDKGPTLTTYISIPGRYLVLMPSLARTGVSRKIDDEKERRRLKRILSTMEIPEGMGVIVRTAGIGKHRTELKRDLEYVLASWDNFQKEVTRGRHPTPLYQESNVAIRTMRDLFKERTVAVHVDDPEVFESMREFTLKLMPEHEKIVRLHEGPRPLFHTHSVEQDFEKIFSRRVELPSGGSVVFDQTEALVAIDVNSGRTREAGAQFEDIALKTNLEAVPEIARQIRLRDLGGIIVVDFIDMMRAGSRRELEKQFRGALSQDRARSKIGRISQFGLLELTRQRLGPGLSKLLYDNCPHCRGTGRERTAESRAHSVLRRLGSALTLKGFSRVDIRARPEVIRHLQSSCSGELRALAERSGRELTFTEVPGQLEDSVLRYLRADGREVRPGGRRKS